MYFRFDHLIITRYSPTTPKIYAVISNPVFECVYFKTIKINFTNKTNIAFTQQDTTDDDEKIYFSKKLPCF